MASRSTTRLAIVTAAWAGLPNLPSTYEFRRTGSSPGVVTFNHRTHLLEEEPNCATCHPVVFSALEAGKAFGLGDRITHEAMDQGKACGACHGKDAFNLDKCDRCHKSR
jgi:c(7)-type cytochrome triheme protein